MSLDAIGIVAHDLEKALKFYGLLGLEFNEAGGPEHLEATLPSGLRLMLDAESLVKKIDPSWTKPTGSSAVVLAFLQDSPAQVNEVYQSVIDSGFKGHKEPWDAFWGQRYSSVLDPDGNQVDIFASL